MAFAFGTDSAPKAESLAGPDAESYFPTPQWFAAGMLDKYVLPRLRDDDVLVEPSCGDGSFLREFPAHVKGYGVEIDAKLAEVARATSGRTVLTGDFLKMELPIVPTKIVGNPPFSSAWVQALLSKMYGLAEDGLEVTLLLPSYFFQTSNTVSEIARRFSINVEMIPRDLFGGFDKPLCVATFTKEYERQLIGLAFYRETNEWRKMPAEYNAILRRSKTNVWLAATLRAMHELGGKGSIDQVARVVSGYRPTSTNFWREAIRRALAQHFVRIDHGVYAIPKSLLVTA